MLKPSPNAGEALCGLALVVRRLPLPTLWVCNVLGRGDCLMLSTCRSEARA